MRTAHMTQVYEMGSMSETVTGYCGSRYEGVAGERGILSHFATRHVEWSVPL